ncbi:MAG: dienelactone hydrolase family protein [Chloroflexi bacterium]|nr:dienelactone hydrolase family protein [Chloroflexota bacterium]
MTNAPQQGHLSLPHSGSGPGLLVLHAWWGLNDFFRGLCDRLAGEGFVAYAPDLYRGKLATNVDEAKRLRSGMDRKQTGADLTAALAYLRGLGAVSGGKLGLLGFSLGANLALGLSVEQPEAIGAVVLFYGTRGGDYTPAQAAYLGHFAQSDEWVAASGVQKLHKALRAADRPATFHTYAGTGHWFFEADRPEAYHPEAAALAWQRTLAFLRARLAARP